MLISYRLNHHELHYTPRSLDPDPSKGKSFHRIVQTCTETMVQIASPGVSVSFSNKQWTVNIQNLPIERLRQLKNHYSLRRWHRVLDLHTFRVLVQQKMPLECNALWASTKNCHGVLHQMFNREGCSQGIRLATLARILHLHVSKPSSISHRN